MGNNKCCEVKGVGTMRIKMHDSIERLLQQVRYIPSLKRNLISLGTLDMNGYSYKALGGIMTVVSGSLVIMKGKIDNGLYVLQGSTVIGSVSLVQEKSDLAILKWHKRLAHISERGMLELEKQGLIDGEKLGKLEFYENFVFRKSARLRFTRSEHTTIGVLNYIHSDLWVHLNTQP